jgi:Xaa-Pro dipeptidase
MDDRVSQIRAEDINPVSTGPCAPALGIMGSISSESTIAGHRYRLSRVRRRWRLPSSVPAGLRRQQHPLHHLDQIGEWERDKLSRWALLTRTGEPILWDFGSAAVHHKLYTPWLLPGTQGRPDRAARHRQSAG